MADQLLIILTQLITFFYFILKFYFLFKYNLKLLFIFIIVSQYCQHGYENIKSSLLNNPTVSLEWLFTISSAHASIVSKRFMGLFE